MSHGDEAVASQIFWYGLRGYEPEVSSAFLDLARSARVTLDIGAHVGIYALVAALANRNGTVHAFEPLPIAYERLVENVELNKLTNLVCHPLALSATPGFMDFYHLPLTEGMPSMSSLSQKFMESHFGSRIEHQVVKVVTVDDFIAEWGIEAVDLVKIDTESTELDVLIGMAKTLERDRPVILCEVLPDADVDGITAILDSLGYKYQLMTDTGARDMARIVPDSRWRNYLFLPDRRP